MKTFFNQWIKPAALFLFGVAMIVWGYMANASNSENTNEKKDIVKKEDDLTQVETDSISGDTNKEEEQTPLIVPEATPKDPAVSTGSAGGREATTKAAPVKKSAVKAGKKSANKETEAEAAPIVIETDKKAEEATGTE